MLPHLIIDFSDPSLLCWWPHRPRGLITEFVLVSGFLFPSLVTPTPGSQWEVSIQVTWSGWTNQRPMWAAWAHMPWYCNLLQLVRLIIGCMIGKQAIVLQHTYLDSVMAILIDTDTLYIFCTIFYLVFSILLAHFLCNTIMPLFTNILPEWCLPFCDSLV